MTVKNRSWSSDSAWLAVRKNPKDVADMLGISQSYISRLEKELLNDYKKNLTKWSKKILKSSVPLLSKESTSFLMILVITRAYFSIPRRY